MGSQSTNIASIETCLCDNVGVASGGEPSAAPTKASGSLQGSRRVGLTISIENATILISLQLRIFVPSEKNSLVDILLARSVTGESPSKCATRTKPGFSPVCERRESRDGEASADGVQDATALEVAPLVDVKAKRVAKGPRKTAKKLKGKAAKEDHVESLENELPLPGE